MSILIYASSMTEWHGASTVHCILSSRGSSLLILKTLVPCYADRECPQSFIAGKVGGTPAISLFLPTDALQALRTEADMAKLGKYMFSSCKVRWSALLWLVTNNYCQPFSAKRQPSQGLLPSACTCVWLPSHSKDRQGSFGFTFAHSMAPRLQPAPSCEVYVPSH